MIREEILKKICAILSEGHILMCSRSKKEFGENNIVYFDRNGVVKSSEKDENNFIRLGKLSDLRKECEKISGKKISAKPKSPIKKITVTQFLKKAEEKILYGGKKISATSGKFSSITVVKEKKLIPIRGLSLPIKLFTYDRLNTTPSKLMTILKKHPYTPKKKKGFGAGFTKVSVKEEKTVVAEFVVSYRVPVLAYNNEGELSTTHYMTIDRGTAIIRPDKESIVIRGSERIAKKFVQLFEKTTGCRCSNLTVSNPRRIFNEAVDISSVMLTGIEKGNLSRVEFRGLGIKTEEEIALYTRRYKASISRFRGSYHYPSGAILTTVINADNGTLLIYKAGDGIQTRDVNWITSMMMDSSDGH